MKLLICDDDMSTIDVIQSQLDCQQLEIKSILRAYNGEAAIEMIVQEHPELILCDIGMPKVNGIEVLKFIYENNIYSEFAFLTCYEDFEYAKEAVRYGAKNYLTKPIDFKELNDALLRMVAAVKKHRNVVEKMEDQNIVDARKNSVLRQIHDGFYGTNRERIENILQRNGLAPLSADTDIRLVIMAAETTEAYNSGWEQELLAYSYSVLAEESLTDHVGSVSTVVNIGERYLYTTTFIPAEQVTEESCAARAKEFSRLCSMHLSMMPVCLISDKAPLYQCADVVAELRTQVKKVLLQAGGIYFLRDVRTVSNAAVSLLDDVAIIRLMKENNKTAYIDMVARAVDKIAYSHKDNSGMMTLLHQDLFQAFYSCLRDNNIPVRSLFQNEKFRLLDQNAVRSSSDMVNYASYLYDCVTDELRRKNEETDMIGTIKRYIEEHYKENIDRNAVAAVVYITPNYLSKRFRAEMGMSLREYINRLRTEEAKRLLLSTNATISEVASEVGYDNISYFSTVFRKLCGMSPIEWCGGKRNEDGSK